MYRTQQMCNRSPEVSSCEAEFYAASACAGELLGLAELFKELYYKVSVRLEMDSDSARHILQRRGPAGLKHIGLQLSRGVSSFSFNMSQIVHYVDIDICYTNTVSSLPLSSLLFVFFLLQLVHRLMQFSCTTLILTRARTWIEQALSFILSLRKQEQFTLSS